MPRCGRGKTERHEHDRGSVGLPNLPHDIANQFDVTVRIRALMSIRTNDSRRRWMQNRSVAIPGHPNEGERLQTSRMLDLVPHGVLRRYRRNERFFGDRVQIASPHDTTVTHRGGRYRRGTTYRYVT